MQHRILQIVGIWRAERRRQLTIATFDCFLQISFSELFSQNEFVFCIFLAPVGVPAVAGIPCRQRPNQPFLFAHFAHTLRVASVWILRPWVNVWIWGLTLVFEILLCGWICKTKVSLRHWMWGLLGSQSLSQPSECCSSVLLICIHLHFFEFVFLYRSLVADFSVASISRHDWRNNWNAFSEDEFRLYRRMWWWNLVLNSDSHWKQMLTCCLKPGRFLGLLVAHVMASNNLQDFRGWSGPTEAPRLLLL